MKRFIILCFLLLPFLCSCVKEVTMDAMEEPQVVVECILCDEPVQTLYLTYTKGASREVVPELSEAEASLTDLTEGREVGRFTRAADGSWQLSYTAIPLHNYRLDVSVPGHEPIWAEQTMPEAPSLDAEWDWWREDLPGDAKYRMVHGYVFSVDTLRFPVWFYGTNYHDMESMGEMTENLVTDYPDVDRFNEQSSQYFDGLTFDSYFFRPSAYPELVGAANHRHYLRFPEREAERTEFLISGDFRGYLEDKRDFIHSRKRFPELHYFAASEDYDKFLSDAYQLEQASTSSDLSSIFLRDNVYSNIQGATGIFGAKIERTLLWDDDRYWGDGPFLFSEYERSIDFSLIAYTYETSSSNYEVGKDARVSYDNARWQEHRPFSLLHYELRGSNGCPEGWKYGAQKLFIFENEASWYAYSRFAKSIYRIDSEEQLRDHGLDGFGSVDFTRKSVIVAYSIFGRYASVPYLVDYWVQEDSKTGRCICTLYMVHISSYYNIDYGGIAVLYPDISSRVAIVVDKIDEDIFPDVELHYDHLRCQTRATFIDDNILPELGISFNNKVRY